MFWTNNQVETDFQKLLKLIRLRMNGVTSTSMQEKGMNYDTNYGVSYPVLKELAARFKRNNLLALKLWHHNWRETYILATLLTDTNTISHQLISEMVSSGPTEEVMNHVAGNTLVKRPDLEAQTTLWLSSNNHTTFATACKALTKWAILHSFVPNIITKSFSDWEKSDLLFDDAISIRALADMLRIYGRFVPEMRNAILAWASKQKDQSNNKAWLPKLDELETEFEYL